MQETIIKAEDSNLVRDSFSNELKSILNFWMDHSLDYGYGGFFGEMDTSGQPLPEAVKGSVLNARILWSFSAAYNHLANHRYLAVARRAFSYLRTYFIDPVNSGVYWSVNAQGEPVDTKKQIYALAFTIYGLAEYYKATQEEEALTCAISLYNAIEQYSYDPENGGYLEAFSRTWEPIDNLRLSEKDANEKKTMNTHLHVLEAYTTLYKVWPNKELARQLHKLIIAFEEHILNTESGHLHLFMNERWEVKSDTLSYGHDIEASWLLVEAAEALHDEPLLNRIRPLAIKIAEAAADGLNRDGSMNYEFEPTLGHLIDERHWWVQAEAVVGFYNAYQISGEQHFYHKANAIWQYINKSIIDRQYGEWHWGRLGNGAVMEGYGKGGFWKCPYHNSRACLEMMARLT